MRAGELERFEMSQREWRMRRRENYEFDFLLI